MHAAPGTVTIGIPTRNRRPLLERALESVLTQSYQDIQVIVSDDASTDETAEYLSEITNPRVVRLHHPVNIGLAANFQACLLASTSEFFLLLNDDDTLLPTAIEKLRHAFLYPPSCAASSSVGIVWCPFINIDEEGRELWTAHGAPAIEPSIDLIAGLFDGTRGPICSAVMMRTADALAVGGYEARFGELCESPAWGKAALLRDFSVCVDEPLMRYLVHTQSATTAQDRGDRWQNLVRQQIDDFAAMLVSRNNPSGAARLRRSGNHLLANITASVMMRWVGRPGWVANCARECWRSRSFMFKPFVVKRLLHDGWKLALLHRRNNYPEPPASAYPESQTSAPASLPAFGEEAQ